MVAAAEQWPPAVPTRAARCRTCGASCRSSRSSSSAARRVHGLGNGHCQADRHEHQRNYVSVSSPIFHPCHGQRCVCSSSYQRFFDLMATTTTPVTMPLVNNETSASSSAGCWRRPAMDRDTCQSRHESWRYLKHFPYAPPQQATRVRGSSLCRRAVSMEPCNMTPPCTGRDVPGREGVSGVDEEDVARTPQGQVV